MGLFSFRLSRKPIKGNAKLVHILLVTLIFMLTFFGLFANRFTLRGRQRFIFSKIYLSYAMSVTAVFTSIYLRQIYLDYTNAQLNLRDAVKLYSYMNITVAVINFITQMVMSKQVAQMMSKVALFKTLNELHIDGGILIKSVLLALFKVIGFPLLIELALVLQQKRNEPHIYWAWSLYKLFPMVISNFLNNCYFGAMVVGKNILDALNSRLKKQVVQVNLMHKNKHCRINSKFYCTQRYCVLADELDMLAVKYKIICIQATEYMALMSLSMVLSLICHVLGITVGIFNQYYAIAEAIIACKPYDAFGAFINFIFLVISLLEIAMLAYLSNDVLIATQATGIILQEMTLENADWRYQQGVHSFSLQVITMKYRIKPMGLFDIDVSLINGVLSTVASFSLILVQSDLSQRFM